MKTTKALNLQTGEVMLSDGSIKYLDSYVFELEDRILETLRLLPDPEPDKTYLFTGEELWKVLDILESRTKIDNK